MQSAIAAFVVVALVASASATVGPVPVDGFFEVNLDLSPADRWTAIGAAHKDVAKSLLYEYIDQVIPKAALPIIDLVGGGLDYFLGDTGEEIKGYAKALDVPVGLMLALHYGYELRPIGGGRPNTTNSTDGEYYPNACSSILAQQTDGVIVHGRNLDWNIPDKFKQLVIQLNFTKGGETQFYATSFVGYSGVLTGMRPNAFSVSINERDMGGNILDTLKQGILNKSPDVASYARQVLTEATTYDDAKLMLEGGKILSPVFYILAGTQPNQGVVITRDRDDARDVWYLAPPSRWFLVETNYDHWETPYKYDNRRDPENKMMNAIGQSSVDRDQVFHVLSSWPANNEHTTYTVMMSPSGGYFQTYNQMQGN